MCSHRRPGGGAPARPGHDPVDEACACGPCGARLTAETRTSSTIGVEGARRAGSELLGPVLDDLLGDGGDLTGARLARDLGGLGLEAQLLGQSRALLLCQIEIIYNTILRFTNKDNATSQKFEWLATAWAVFQTFVFITFTRLFFRSGSNLDPEEANTHAWNTAKSMVNQIGSKWNFDIIPTMIWEYRSVFIIFVLGMIIHWLPTNFKRRYRMWFASMPVWVMGLVVILTIFVLYQFVSADLQKFIYFQF